MLHEWILKIKYFKKFAQLYQRCILYLPSDYHIGWLPFALAKGFKLCLRNKIHVIYSTSSPYTAHIIALLLKKLFKLPWIADFRDEWSLHRFRNPHYSWQRKVDKWLEKSVFLHADNIIMTTNSYQKEYQEMFPDQSHKIHTITNGFDKDDFKNLSRRDSTKFVISYVGLFYGSNQPDNFLIALNRWLEDYNDNRSMIEVKFVGPNKDSIKHDLLSGLLKSIVKFTGLVSHDQAVKIMRESTILLLIASRGRGHGNIPGKTFEYIASERPILALSPLEGDLAGLIRATQSGYLVDPDNVHEIKKQLQSMYSSWLNGSLKSNLRKDVLSQFEAKSLTHKLSHLIAT